MNITSTIEQEVLEAIDMEGLLAFVCELVAFPSLNGTEAEAAVQAHIGAKMREIGLTVDEWELDFEALKAHPAYSAEVERSRGLGVVGTIGQDAGGRSLIFNGHSDVVPAGDEANWQYPPWEGTINREEGRLYGRGALDMKGGLACTLFAAKALLDAGIRLRGKLMVQSVSGEEDGGVGTLAAVMRGYQADAAVILEPTELIISPAQAGALNFRITIPGRAAHGAMRAEGIDPLEKFILIYQTLLTLEKVRNRNVTHPMFAKFSLPYPICVGTIQGGIWASTVAESLTFEGRYGVAVDEDIAAAKAQFERTIAQAANADEWLRHNPPLVTWWGGQFAPASIPTDSPIVRTMIESFQLASGRSAQVYGVTYGADMRLLVNEGKIPTVLFGPGNVRKAHQPDEYVPLADLETAVRTITLAAMRFCGFDA